MIDLKKLLKSLPEDLDFATVKKMAKSLENDPMLRKAYEENLSKEGFENTVDKLADKIEDLFNHKDSQVDDK